MLSSITERVGKVEERDDGKRGDNRGEPKEGLPSDDGSKRVNPEGCPVGSFVVPQCTKCGRDGEMVEIKVAGLIPGANCNCGG